MARIKEVKEIPLENLVIGKGQVRLHDVNKEIDELAESIRIHGLLEPIVVCPAEKSDKYEILTGQRRFLAHQRLKKDTILAAVLDERVDEATAKVLSLTENLMRRDLNSKDLIDACTVLYRKYGSIRAVVEETGLSSEKVRAYVKYDRLDPKLRSLVDKGEVEMKAALRAQDAANTPAEAEKLAKEMASMSGAQQRNLTKKRLENPTTSVDDIIEAAKSGERITQITVTLGAELHKALQTYAKQEGTSLDDAAAGLISESLSTRGFLEE